MVTNSAFPQNNESSKWRWVGQKLSKMSTLQKWTQWILKRVQCWSHKGPCKSPWSCNAGFILSAVAEGDAFKFSNQYTCFTFSALLNKTGTFYNFIHESACLMMSGWSISPSIYFENFTIVLEMLVKMWSERLDADLFRCISFLTFSSPFCGFHLTLT